MTSHWRWLGAISLWALASTPGLCAGGAHVVDDSAVENPGTCHVENWLSLGSHGTDLANIGPACTPKALPNLELGGFLIHDWAAAGSETVIGLSPKFTLQSEYTGLGIALSGSLGLSADHGRLANAGLIVPFTIPASTSVRLNFNLGWQWVRGQGHAAFVGAQAEMAIAPDWSLMTEAFSRTIGKPGGQVGLRWNPHRGKVDLDLIGGRHVDGTTPAALTFGLTIRI